MQTVSMFVVALIAVFSFALGGCGAMQTTAHEPGGAGNLKPTEEDKDAGLVGIAPGFGLKDYPVVVVRQFKVTEPERTDAEDRKLAAEMPSFLQGELVRRLRESGLFTRVVNANETDYTPGAEKALVLEGEITAAYGIFGGDSREHLRESFDDMARDVAKFLIRLSKGEAPKKE